MNKNLNLRTIAIAIVLFAVITAVILAGSGNDLAGTGGGGGRGNNNGGRNGGGNGGGNGGQPTEIAAPTDAPPPTQRPTNVPPTNVPPTNVPPTNVPPTNVPPTNVPPTEDNTGAGNCAQNNPGWDCSSLSVSGRCEVRDGVAVAVFTVTNTGDPGDGNMQGSTSYEIFINGTASGGGTIDPLNGGSSREYPISAENGDTVRFVAQQRPGHPGNSTPQAEVTLNCGPTNTNTPRPTNTRPAPTNTPRPTNTPEDEPTNTPEDGPTNTPHPTNTPDDRRYTICHVAGRANAPANYVILRNIPYQAFRGHFDENGTPLAGHEQDFIINGPEDEARCQAPSVTNTPSDDPTPTPDDQRYTICHVAGRAGSPANYVILRNIPYQAFRGHFDENGTPLAGHEQDFIITSPEDEARCRRPENTPTATPEEPTPSSTPRNDRYTICHVAGRAGSPANYVILRNIPYQAFRGHFDENGTPLAGHEQDFIITSPEDEARCQEPVTPTATPPVTPTDTPTPYPCDERNSCSEIQVRAACVDAGTGSPVASFSIVNAGVSGEGDMLGATEYRLFIDGEQVDSGRVQLAGGESLDLQLVGAIGNTASIEVDQEFDYPGASPITAEITLDCVELTPTPTSTPEPQCGDITYDEKGFPVPYDGPECEDTTPTPTPPDGGWVPPAKGPAVCVDWLVYHTDMTGDWEIFRLGELPDGQTGDPNLSKGVEAFDVAPSRSPDALNIAFASNRDGNWEIYIAAVDGSLTERVTYNSQAIDIDPVWSPANDFIAYESNRLGNWEVYMVNVDTGVETQLTNDAGNDLNPYFAPDGSKLLFQSDRNGFWQIYEYDLSSGETKLFSDGTADDHDPQYSNDGKRVLFRSYRDSDNSGIYVANADGSDVQLISDVEGNATNPVWAPNDLGIAYQSDLDNDLDIYVYEFESEATRLVTDNDIADYAPTWICDSPTVVFTSDITEDPNIFSTGAFPIDAPAIKVETDASQLTDDPANDQYPQNSPAEENASRQGSLPSPERNRALGAN